MKKREIGFTLIELMIAVAIIGILIAIAYPSYRGHVERTHRDMAKAALQQFASAMERHYMTNNSYLGAGTANNNGGNANSAGAPAAAVFPSAAPLDGTDKFYDLTIEGESTATSYTLRATPRAILPNEGYLELLSTGVRRWDRNNDGDTADANETSWD